MALFVHYQTHQNFRFGLSFTPAASTLNQLIKLISPPPGEKSGKDREHPQNTLNGRRNILIADLPEMGRVAVKTYARGGLIYHINKEHYLRLGKTRCQREFEFMQKATLAGINAPEPIAFVSYGRRIYKAWLITRVVANHQTFATLCQNHADRAKTLLPAIAENIDKLIAAKIYHVDLHPGNILIDDSDTPYVIDFDRARFFSGDTARLRKKYRRRWDRAINKHDLPLFARAVFEKITA